MLDNAKAIAGNRPLRSDPLSDRFLASCGNLISYWCDMPIPGQEEANFPARGEPRARALFEAFAAKKASGEGAFEHVGVEELQRLAVFSWLLEEEQRATLSSWISDRAKVCSATSLWCFLVKGCLCNLHHNHVSI